MTAVGIFAGRGDVVLAMGLALLVGAWLGWNLRGLWLRIRKPKTRVQRGGAVWGFPGRYLRRVAPPTPTA